jgi:hypothetical protein
MYLIGPGVTMKNYTLTFRIDFFEDWVGYEQFKNDDPRDAHRRLLKMNLEDEKRKELYSGLGLKLFSGAWTSIALNETNAQRLLKAVEALKAARTGFLGRGILREEPTLEEDTCEWFELYRSAVSYTGTDFDDRGLAYPVCKASNYSPSHHFIRPHFVSERFKKVVERTELTGLEFLWVRDVGKYKASQWYAAIANQPLGFGVDHPWYNREGAVQRMGRLPENAFGGMHSFSGKDYKMDWTTGSHTLDSLLSQFPMNNLLGLSFSSPPRYQRKYLPETDFAYRWRNPDCFALYDSQVLIRSRLLCCNAKARDILINERVLNEQDFESFVILDEVLEGIVHLDQKYPCPAPFYTNEEMADLRVAEGRYWKQCVAKEKPERHPDIRRAMRILRDAKRQRPNDFLPRISTPKATAILKELPVTLPEAWVNVVLVSNGGKFGVVDELECEVEPLAGLRQMNAEEVNIRRKADDDFAGGYVYFAKNGYGDLYAFQKEECAAIADCPVVLISHEDFDTTETTGSGLNNQQIVSSVET